MVGVSLNGKLPFFIRGVSVPESIRISDKEFSTLKAAKQIGNRSIGGQAEHWMKIGRAIEKSSAFSYQHIQDALTGDYNPEELTPEEDAVFVDEYMDSLLTPTAEQDSFFTQRKKDKLGVGLDAKNNIITHHT